jgi:hypothetical protein
MLKRTAMTAAVWLVGFLFLLTDGQHFTHGIVVLLSAIVGALPWVPLLRRRHTAGKRVAALAVVGGSAVIVVKVCLHLPAAYEAQRRFNTDEQAVEADGPLRGAQLDGTIVGRTCSRPGRS